MPHLDEVLQPRVSRERQAPPYPLILEGELAVEPDGFYLRVDDAALVGPVEGGGDEGDLVVAAISQEGIPYLVYPSAGGDVGPQGPPGPTGPQGAAGPAGAPGPIGPKGDPGATGSTGATGATGPQGATGTQGPAGATGSTGPQGVQGPAGPAGPSPAVQDEGAALSARSALNFTGSGVVAFDDAANGRTVVNVGAYTMAERVGSTTSSGNQTFGNTPTELNDRGATFRLTVPAHPTVQTLWAIGGHVAVSPYTGGVWMLIGLSLYNLVGMVTHQYQVQSNSALEYGGQLGGVIGPQLIAVGANAPQTLRLVAQTFSGYIGQALSGNPNVPLHIYAMQVGGPPVA